MSYSTIRVACPSCGDPIEFQTKGGDRECAHYAEHDAPEDAIRVASPETCCGVRWRLKVEYRPHAVVERG